MKDLLLPALTLVIAACSGPAADSPVKGYYRADGRESTLSFVRSAAGEPLLSGTPSIDLAFTEKNAADARDLSANTIAFSHKYGSAIVVNLFKQQDGTYAIGASSFHHSLSDKAGGNGGNLQVRDVVVANNTISGEIFTPPGSTLFDVKVDIDLKFKAPMPR